MWLCGIFFGLGQRNDWRTFTKKKLLRKLKIGWNITWAIFEIVKNHNFHRKVKYIVTKVTCSFLYSRLFHLKSFWISRVVRDILKKNSPTFPDQIFTKFPDFLLRIFLFETSTYEISRSKVSQTGFYKQGFINRVSMEQCLDTGWHPSCFSERKKIMNWEYV